MCTDAISFCCWVTPVRRSTKWSPKTRIRRASMSMESCSTRASSSGRTAAALYSFDEAVTELLTAPDYDIGNWILAGPPASYLQFPYQRLWARVSADAPYEPLDGVFAVAAETEQRADSGAHLRAQMVLGLRPDRPGVSLVSYRDDIDPAEVAERAEHPWRAEGVAYANAIPGGERMGYRTLATTSELEALVIRAFHYLDTHPDRLERITEEAGEDATHLPYVRVR